MKRRKRGDNNGFAEWGGYMEAKKAKLQDQFKSDAAREPSSDTTNIFNGVAIFVNGYSVPSADELKLLMMKHGGVYHHYYRTDKTTHIIATNLPDTKVKQLKNMNVVKPDWVVDSIAAGRLLDYREYLLYSRQTKTQPKLMFKPIAEGENRSCTTFEAEEDDNCFPTDGDGFANKHQESNSSSPRLFCSEQDEKVKQAADVPCASKSVNQGIKTASEAGFLSEFYSNSRLHHISTMGAMFKQYVNTLRKKNKGIFPGVNKLKLSKQSESSIDNISCNSIVNNYGSIIMHIDMDCFFVSVGLRKRPDLKEFPVAVTHAKTGGRNSSTNRAGVNRKAEFELYKTRREEKYKGTNEPGVEGNDAKPWSDWVEAISESDSMSEIASCNYEARKFGLKNGMFLGQALKLCPNLKTISYDFEGYKEVAFCLYDTVASYTVDIEAVSCDEMFVDCTSLLNSTGTSPQQLATLLRAEIKEKTDCPCSTGFGSNRLQARLATRQAKPDGQFYLDPSSVQTFMEGIQVSDLPGVGRSTSYRLAAMGVQTCLDLQQISLTNLQSEFGVKSGESLYKHCRGEDTKKLLFGQLRKSVSAEVNYGIRFKNAEEAETFLQELVKEVHNRLQEVNMKTKLITLKLMIKAKDAPAESAKFLGHGVCDHVSRSSTLQTSVCDLDTITREVMSLTRQLNADPTELRGIGIQLSRLESTEAATIPRNRLDKFLLPKSEIAGHIKQSKPKTIVEKSNSQREEASSSSSVKDFFTVKKRTVNETKTKSMTTKPIKPSEIDKNVLNSLPENIRREVMQEYGLSPGEEEERPVTDQGLNQLNYSQIDLDVLDELPLDIKQEIQSEVNKKRRHSASNVIPEDSANGDIGKVNSVSSDEPKLDRTLPLSEVRALIKAWTASEDSPQNCDISMLADYFQGLVFARQLHSLDICICCLYRCIEKRQCALWQEAYREIITIIQRAMLNVYGLRLKVPHTFLKTL